uniref:Col_cuticle_N domain-containing protein n=2 Tax=Bursaphelenchus xylophilus TaxID=6326 RepID=A0A1I7SJW4_BURXY
MDSKEQLRDAESFKRLAFTAIAISTVATLTAIIVVPMLYNYMQHVQSSLDEELEFCTHRSNGLWEQYKVLYGEHAVRAKREATLRRIPQHRNFRGRRGMKRTRQAYGGDSGYGAAPAPAPVHSYGGSANVGSYNQGVSGGSSVGGGSCSCGVGQ